MTVRSNEEWLSAFKQTGEDQLQAMETLRIYMVRTVLVYLREHRSDLADWTGTEIRGFADDIAQDALLLIRKNLDSFRGDSEFTTWAYRFAINLAAGELRLSRYRELSLDGLQEQETAALMDLMQEKRVSDPDVAVERRAYLELLDQIIRSELTERQRIAIVAVHFQGRSMAEVAEQLGITSNALYKLLHDARRKIKARLQDRHLGAGDILALFEE